MTNDELELTLSQYMNNVHERFQKNEVRLNECERLLAMYQQMFGDINSAHRIIGERLDNHAQQIKIVDEKVMNIADALLKYVKVVVTLSRP